MNLAGGLQFNTPFIAAPLAGVSSLPFRLMLKKGGAGLVYTEMVSAAGLIRNQPSTLRLCATLPEESPLIVQLFTADPLVMEKAAAKIRQMNIAAGVDINMGCPVRKVRRQGAGSALLDDSNKAKEIIEAAQNGWGDNVTIKIRLGYKENCLNEFLPALLKARPLAIALHARTVTQGYGGEVDWSAIKKLKAAINIPVIGNGDVKDAQQAVDLLKYSNCDYLMIGRAAMGDPYIYARATALLYEQDFIEPAPCLIHELLKKSSLEALRLGGEKFAMHFLRQFLVCRAKGKSGIGSFRKAAGRAPSLDELFSLAERYFTQGETYAH